MKLRKAQKNLNARRNAFDNSKRQDGRKRPGSMKGRK